MKMTMTMRAMITMPPTEIGSTNTCYRVANAMPQCLTVSVPC